MVNFLLDIPAKVGKHTYNFAPPIKHLTRLVGYHPTCQITDFTVMVYLQSLFKVEEPGA